MMVVVLMAVMVTSKHDRRVFARVYLCEDARLGAPRLENFCSLLNLDESETGLSET